MSQFDEYLLDDNGSKSPRVSKYVILDSDQQHDQFSRYIAATGPTNLNVAMSKLDTNLPSPMANKKYTNSESGTISKHLKNKKEHKIMIDGLKFNLNKIQSQCEALEQLIQKTIKKQAQLQVQKRNLMRKQQMVTKKSNTKPMKSKRNQKQNYHPSLLQHLDIGKTIKPFSSKFR